MRMNARTRTRYSKLLAIAASTGPPIPKNGNTTAIAISRRHWRQPIDCPPKTNKGSQTMTKIVAMTLLFVALLVIHPSSAQAANGHENSCSVVNVNYSIGVMTIICATGSINMALLTGNSIAGTCPTVDMDTMKIMTSLALAARVSGLFLTIWYTDSCLAVGSPTTRAIVGIEVKGN